MDLNRLGAHAKDTLRLRNLFVRPGTSRGVVQVRVDDGSRDGFLIGWVQQEPHPYLRGLAWQSHARRAISEPGYWQGERIDAEYDDGNEAGGAETIERAIQDVVYIASYGDVLAARDLASGKTGTYVATMDPVHSEWLAELGRPTGMTDLGGGRVRLTSTAVAYFRGSPGHMPYVDVDDQFHLDPMDPPYQLTRES